MDWPTVTIVIVTWNRPSEIRRTIDALRKYVRYGGPIRVHIADDGSPQGYIEGLRSDYPTLNFSSTGTPRKGWGANVNAALRAVASDYIFLIEDDYVARRVVDLERGVALLEAVGSAGMIRYDGIEGHQFTLKLCEAETEIGRIHYLWVLKDSPSAYVYSNRPHLVHRRFHEAYGPYYEDVKLGATEIIYGIEVRLKDGPQVVCLSDGIDRAFDHVGHTWRKTEHNIGKEVLFQ